MKAPGPPTAEDQVHGQHADDWFSGRLEDYWAVTDCKHVTAAFVDSGYPVVSIGEVQSRYVDLRNAPRTTRDFYRLLTQGPRKPVPGDLIMSRNASVGHVAQVADRHQPFAMGQDVCLLRKRRNTYSPDYLQFLLKSPSMEKQFSNLMAGSTFKRLNVQDIKDLRITFPAPLIQASIGEALGNTEDQIEALERLIAKKQAIKQGMMQQLLTGKTRLPGFNKEWIDANLGRIAEVTMGQAPSGSSYNTTGVGLPLVQGNADIRDRRTIDRLWTSEPTKRCSVGEVVLTVRAPVGFAAIATKASCLGRGVCSLNARNSNRFLYHALVYAEPRWSVFEQGSTFTAVNSDEVHAFTIKWPSDAGERTAIADVLDDTDSEIETLNVRLAKAKAIKQGMLQELLTGRTRLPVAEALA